MDESSGTLPSLKRFSFQRFFPICLDGQKKFSSWYSCYQVTFMTNISNEYIIWQIYDQTVLSDLANKNFLHRQQQSCLGWWCTQDWNGSGQVLCVLKLLNTLAIKLSKVESGLILYRIAAFFMINPLHIVTKHSWGTPHFYYTSSTPRPYQGFLYKNHPNKWGPLKYI